MTDKIEIERKHLLLMVDMINDAYQLLGWATSIPKWGERRFEADAKEESDRFENEAVAWMDRFAEEFATTDSELGAFLDETDLVDDEAGDEEV